MIGMTRWRLQLVLMMALIFSATVEAKCVTASVTVSGRVENLPSVAAPTEATVVVETSKGNFSRTASISNGEFRVEVSFSKWSSTFFGGDRCHNEAKFVEVKIVSVGKVYAERRFSFKDNFEMYSPFLYRLKRDLLIDVLNGSGSKEK